jgi:peptidoglycan/xylan/chitin deacetylase (PgdA/CDA1 family)
MMHGDHRSPRRRRRSAWPLVRAVGAVVVLAAGGAAIAWSGLGRPASDVPPAAAQLSPTASPAPTVTPPPASSPTPASSVAPAPSSTGSLPPRPHVVADPQPVSILVYHHVLKRAKGSPLVVMSVARFRAQLAYLAAHGYQAVTLRRVYDAWTGEGLLPPRPVVVTFDDGYADQVRNAAPVLRRYGWPAELDLITESLYRGADAPAARLTPGMVQGLLDAGWGLESHSVSHPDLTQLHGARLRRQLRESRRRLEDLFDVQVDFFCYPGGIYTRRVKLAVRRAGYLAATGTRYGAATPTDLFSLPRIYCYGGESLRVFGERLRQALAAAEGG